MFKKFLEIIIELLVSIDQFLHVLIWGIFYIFGLLNKKPSSDETISSYVGKQSMKGKLHYIILEIIINIIFLPFEGWGHCKRHIEKDEGY